MNLARIAATVLLVAASSAHADRPPKPSNTVSPAVQNEAIEAIADYLVIGGICNDARIDSISCNTPASAGLGGGIGAVGAGDAEPGTCHVEVTSTDCGESFSSGANVPVSSPAVCTEICRRLNNNPQQLIQTEPAGPGTSATIH